MKTTIHHADNECPEPVTRPGRLTVSGRDEPKCPGHTVEVPEYTEDEFKIALGQSFGRGYRRAFEVIRRSPPLWVLCGSGCWDEAQGLLRERLKDLGIPEAVSGFDTIK